MAEQFQTSFIPKKTDTPAKKIAAARGGLLTGIAIFLFVVALGGAGGVFLYERFLEASVEQKKLDLERAREAFEPALIQELAKLDGRIETGRTLLRTHIAPSAIFTLLEQLTLENVRYNSFAYSFNEDGVTVTMEGEARGFSAVALQSDVFGDNDVIEDPIFGGLNINQRGNISFTFNAGVDPSLIAHTPVEPLPVDEPAPEMVEPEDEEEGGIFSGFGGSEE